MSIARRITVVAAMTSIVTRKGTLITKLKTISGIGVE